MEPILEGFLVKSPPERKTVGTWKIFGAKWRKRYFVLYAPPTAMAESIGQETITAMLEYYTSKKLHNKCGSIDLANCEEVYSALDSDMYKHVFCIQTTHKCRRRTYYLAAETEAEMNKWVNTLCRVLGLTESDDQPLFLPAVIEAKLQQILQPLTAPRPVTQPPQSKPHPNFATHPQAKPVSPDLPPLRPNTIAFPRFGGSEPNLLEALSPDRRDESRADDKHWFGSPPGSGGGMRNAGSVPELDLLSPKRSGPNRELPPPPPEKGGLTPTPAKGAGMLYDMPQQSYYDAPGSAASSTQSCYNIPPTKYTMCVKEGSDSCYNTPPMKYRPETGDGRDDSCYNVPSEKLHGSGIQSATKKEKHNNKDHRPEITLAAEEFYNVPTARLRDAEGECYENLQSTGRRSREESMRARKSFPPHSTNFSALEETYDVPPASESARRKPSAPRPPPLRAESRKSLPPPSSSAMSAFMVSDQTYDIPPPNEHLHGKTPLQKSSSHTLMPSYGNVASTVMGEETYDTPPSHVTAGKPKPQLGGTYSAPSDSVSHRPVAAARVSVLKDETYDVPPTASQSTGGRHITGSAAHPATSSIVLGDQIYDAPPTKSSQKQAVASPLSGSADVLGLSRANSISSGKDQTSSMPPSVPPIPAKRNPPPPPKPPRPVTVLKPGAVPGPADSHGASVVAVDISAHSAAGTEDSKSAVTPEQEIKVPEKVDRDTVSELQQNTATKGRFTQKESFHSPAAVTPPCIAKKTSAPSIEVRDSIRFTQRSKSFKRSLPSQQRSALPLPIKRVVERDESTSSDDDRSPSPVSQDQSILDSEHLQTTV